MKNNIQITKPCELCLVAAGSEKMVSLPKNATFSGVTLEKQQNGLYTIHVLSNAQYVNVPEENFKVSKYWPSYSGGCSG